MNDRILCCIFNYNQNAGAAAWAERLRPVFDTVILDSGSSPACDHPLAVHLDNLYYSGLMNEFLEAYYGAGWENIRKFIDWSSEPQFSVGSVPALGCRKTRYWICRHFA